MNIRKALEYKEIFIIFSQSNFLPASTKVTGYNAPVMGLFEYFSFDPRATLTR